MEYVNYVDNETKARAGFKGAKNPIPLRKEVPLLGPRFVVPSYADLQHHDPFWDIEPVTAYIKPVHVIHPLYYPSLLD